jgi:hypothetical protein
MKWSEQALIKGIMTITAMCSAGMLTWDEKESLLDVLLEDAGWTRAELQDLNRRRQAVNN